jgi:hydroxypyruvate isomerase
MRHGLPYLVNCSILFTELPLLERPAAAKAAGFDAVEFWWPFASGNPRQTEVDRFVAAVEDAGVRLVALNFAAGDLAGGDRGLLSWPGRTAEFRDSVDAAVAIGARLGTRGFNALYGNRIQDGTRTGAAAARQDELATANLLAAAAAAAGIGATVLLEPVSGIDRYPLRTADDVAAVLDRVGAPNLRLLADLYHLAVNGDDLDAIATTHVHRVGHVQIADAPGRHEPGTGELDLDRHLGRLQDAGYTGWVGLEYASSGSTEAGLAWLPRERRSAAATAS